jgi:hypothetical protein
MKEYRRVMAKDKTTIKTTALRDIWSNNSPGLHHSGAQKMREESVNQNIREQIRASAIMIEIAPKVVRTENTFKLFLQIFKKFYTAASHYFC